MSHIVHNVIVILLSIFIIMVSCVIGMTVGVFMPAVQAQWVALVGCLGVGVAVYLIQETWIKAIPSATPHINHAQLANMIRGGCLRKRNLVLDMVKEIELGQDYKAHYYWHVLVSEFGVKEARAAGKIIDRCTR